jgi:nucleoside 2-deoxyribosyltransferase
LAKYESSDTCKDRALSGMRDKSESMCFWKCSSSTVIISYGFRETYSRAAIIKTNFMKVFITFTFKGSENRKEIEELCEIVKNTGFEDFCFIRDVENYQKIFDDPKELMERAREEIRKCDVLLFDATNKSTGRAIEVGVAYSNKKKIIVLMQKETFIKDTLKGVADAIITYENIGDIGTELRNLYLEWQKA